jgi:hypothetical protein
VGKREAYRPKQHSTGSMYKQLTAYGLELALKLSQNQKGEIPGEYAQNELLLKHIKIKSDAEKNAEEMNKLNLELEEFKSKIA